MDPLIKLQTVTKSFGSVKAANNFSMTLARDEALGIIGPNGAGKSTLFNIITGDISPNEGRIFFDGHDITNRSPHVRCRLGIGRSYQIPHPFANMTVFENLLVGAVFGGSRPERECYDHCREVLNRTDLLPKANAMAGTLTLLERKRLELARALATQPRVLLLDEIAGGLTEHECDALVETIWSIHADGTAIVWIEHIVHALTPVVDRLIVLNFGMKLAEGAPEEVMTNPEVREVYMGIDTE
ncbi:MAG: ABC transporter ATP-binding protein [Dehalococcoidales bacterium]|jgi:branched-chain amino acid transport system ATP-binding protein|nr:ABC transporter ATP-binding protein [Dehalococcoidales bacterium]MDP6080270.1 ABC transporter ATP-binding protein [Arenicellales bacterium]HJP10017.1 ABC transporter ATP-binding protein [Arenicellales bacterium]|tara:strand:- start:3084 stop:3809 length:726 start_codon:yes stop_codon:yes gene_type:complete